jgi:hypothetical protein
VHIQPGETIDRISAANAKPDGSTRIAQEESVFFPSGMKLSGESTQTECLLLELHPKISLVIGNWDSPKPQAQKGNAVRFNSAARLYLHEIPSTPTNRQWRIGSVNGVVKLSRHQQSLVEHLTNT